LHANLTRAVPLILAALAAGCSLQWHDPAPHAGNWRNEPWLLHCETAESYLPDSRGRHGAVRSHWIWASSEADSPWVLDGYLEDGFLRVGRVRTGYGENQRSITPSLQGMRALCVDTLRREGLSARALGKVRAARQGEDLDVPIVVSDHRNQPVSRVVVFGDSLSDTGRLKRRLYIFPGTAYWLGRFSNGPAWADYLETSANLVVQNHAYGGAVAAEHGHLPGEALVALVKMQGQLVVTGSLALQVDDFINQNLSGGRLRQSEKTVFILWTGANDYIWKEPFTGEITTFLNSPQGAAGYERVVDDVVASIRLQVEKLYVAGARQFLLIDLPDMGRTPIVLQNITYFPPHPPGSDAERKLILAERLSTLTRYHNHQLEMAVQQLRSQLPDSQIVLQKVDSEFSTILQTAKATDYGFMLEAQFAALQHGDKREDFPQRCYTGGYLGSHDPDAICERQRRVVFWDVIHPTSFAHCWQAYFTHQTMAASGWVNPPLSLSTYREWCEQRQPTTAG